MELDPHGHDPHRHDPPWHPHDGLLIDCDTCVVRGAACGDCVVTHLLGGPPEPLRLDGDEVGALDALAGFGMVPPLRLVTAVSTQDTDQTDEPSGCWPGGRGDAP